MKPYSKVLPGIFFKSRNT